MTKSIIFSIIALGFLKGLLCANKASDQYYSWLVGNPGDFKLPDESRLDGGILLAGGSTDQDGAMKWFLKKALGGDVIVFRNGRNASVSEYPTADGYNSYLYSELGVNVDSVETIFLNSRNVANNLEVVDKVRKAEAVFFTGGDQAFYYSNIEGTLLQDALNYLVNTKKVVIGGTSAGCAIQGQYGFSADFDTITSSAALKNPYDTKVVLKKDLLYHNLLKNTITDTHYNNPDRRGRHVTFMARIVEDYNKALGQLVYGIGVEEKTAVTVESDGRAYVYGSYSAHFLKQNSLNDWPEQCVEKKPLDWFRNRKPIEVYKIIGTDKGDRYFDLKTWNNGVGGTWLYYYVDRGFFSTN